MGYKHALILYITTCSHWPSNR